MVLNQLRLLNWKKNVKWHFSTKVWTLPSWKHMWGILCITCPLVWGCRRGSLLFSCQELQWLINSHFCHTFRSILNTSWPWIDPDTPKKLYWLPVFRRVSWVFYHVYPLKWWCVYDWMPTIMRWPWKGGFSLKSDYTMVRIFTYHSPR